MEKHRAVKLFVQVPSLRMHSHAGGQAVAPMQLSRVVGQELKFASKCGMY